MKNLRRSIGGMVWVIVAAVFLTAQNMIPNANFEGPVPDANGTWPKPWHTYEWYPMFFTVLSTNARTGTQAMKLQWHGGRCTSAGGQSWHGGNSGIGLRCGGSVRDSNPGNCQPDDTTDNTYNVITLARGTTYELSAWIRFNQYAALTTTAPDGDNSNWGGMRLNMQNNGGGDHGNEFYNLDIQPTPMNVWRQIRGQFTYNETDSRPVQFRLENYGHNIRVDCDMDDVVLMPRSATPVIVVNYPNGGETVAAGSAVKVGWSSLGGGTPPATVDIAVSLDGGSQWTTLASGVPNVSSAVVTMPGTISASCRLRVQQAGGGTASDTSDGNFIISAGGPSGNFALKYDGSDDRVVISTRTPTISNAFTVECWFKWDGGNNHHYDYQVVAGRRTLNSLLEWDIYIQESTRRIGAGVSRTGQFSNATWLESGNNAVSTGTWLHCALVGTGSNYYLYLNRTRVATAAQGGTISGLADVPILVGDLDDSNETFNGVIDELRISNVARYTAATYTVPNAAFAVDANTLGLWHFDEGTGTTTADETANGSAGTLLNGPVWVAGCPFGGGTVNQPPVVNLTSPVNGSTYTAPATVNLVATASDSDGTIASVRFYSGTTLLNTDTSSPYTYSWTGVGAGSYALRAVAQDNQGATSTSTVVNITVYSSGTPVNQPPTVNLTSPVNGSTYTAPATIALAATASDPDGTVVNVRFYQGNTLIGTDTSAPYEGAWLGVSAGTYQLRAVAIDDLGATSTSTVVTVTVLSSGTPAVWYTLTTAVNPANGGTVSPASGTYLASSQIQVTATPNANYTFANWSGDASGTNPTVTITMDANKSITANFTYVSPANSSPTVSITGPANGATFSAPASITITATATDIDGTIAVVRFYSGASQIAQINASPYQYTWTNVPAGNYVLTARAEDNLGATGISAAVSITVNEGVRPPDDVSPGEVRIGGSQDGYFNPLLGQAQIAFRLKTAGVVKVRVYGLRGQLVWEDSVSGTANETKTRLWDGRDKSGASVASGVYIVQVTGGGIDARKKLAVVAQ